jgi:hypothetical protein
MIPYRIDSLLRNGGGRKHPVIPRPVIPHPSRAALLLLIRQTQGTVPPALPDALR